MGELEPAAPITWQELKDFVNAIPEHHLNKNVSVLWADESIAKQMNEPFFIQENVYADKEDYENCGTLKELKEIYESQGEEFDIKDFVLVTPKGAPFLWMDL